MLIEVVEEEDLRGYTMAIAIFLSLARVHINGCCASLIVLSNQSVLEMTLQI